MGVVAALFGLCIAVLPTAEAEVLALSGVFGGKPKFLPVHQAFGVSANAVQDKVSVQFRITPEHYIYQDKLKITVGDGVTAKPWQFNQVANTVDDPIFGQVAVFEQDVIATTTLENASDKAEQELSITWQGCAKAGLCYPPETIKLTVVLDNKAVLDGRSLAQIKTPDIAQSANASQSTPKNIATDPNKTADAAKVPTPVLDKGGQASLEPSSQADDNPSVQEQTLAQEPMPVYSLNHTPSTVNVAAFGLDKNPVLAIVLLLLSGVALAFTACVYPMIPIVANIVAKSERPSAMRGFVLTGAYGLGVATSYGLLGALVAWFGQSLGIVGWLQNRWVLLGFALLFVLLSLQMAGVLRLGLPVGLKQKLSKSSTLADRYLGSVGGSFLVGALSALVVSPCVSAPMAGALMAVAASNNVVLGFWALFALGAGLSLPLVVMGTLEGGFMPKAGEWMEKVKLFGALMLGAVALALLERVMTSPVMLVLWAGWFLLLALFFWRLSHLAWRAAALLSGLWASVVLVGAGMGAKDAWQPLHPMTDKASASALSDIKVTNLAALDAHLQRRPKVLVEVGAEWCVECRVMERTLFANRPAAMADWQLVRLDITDTNQDSRAVLTRYGLFGPPALLYYQEGQLMRVQLGEVSLQDFERALQF